MSGSKEDLSVGKITLALTPALSLKEREKSLTARDLERRHGRVHHPARTGDAAGNSGVCDAVRNHE
jgi:hypothetical protein